MGQFSEVKGKSKEESGGGRWVTVTAGKGRTLLDVAGRLMFSGGLKQRCLPACLLAGPVAVFSFLLKGIFSYPLRLTVFCQLLPWNKFPL